MLLTILVAVMFFSMPFSLLIEHFSGKFKPSLVESCIPLMFSILTIILVWKAKKGKDMNKNLKLLLAIPPLLLALYFGGYFTLRFFF
jgi:hypothetical protein